jgi:asparagine synthase (glutamine-hydrolysing)
VADAKNPFKEYLLLSGIPRIRSAINQGLAINLIRKTLPAKTTEILFEKYNLNKIYLKSLNEKLVSDTLESLTHHLHFGDRLSMAHSVESRVPFLDYRFVEFAASIPECYKIHNGWTKYIARTAMKGSLPENVLWRKDKLGFPVPEEYWFKGPLKEWMKQEINNSEFLETLGYEKAAYNTYNMSKLVRLLSLASWYKTFIL